MQNNIQLSPYFELREFIESATAHKNGIVNEPPAEAVENLKALCVHTLEPLREAMGLPIIITSGYRCKALNELITHHSTRSQHVSGQAADFCIGCPAEIAEIAERAIRKGKGPAEMPVQKCKGPAEIAEIAERGKGLADGTDHAEKLSNRKELLIKAFRQIILDDNIDYDQLILYPSFIHVSYVSREGNHRQLTRAFGDGKYQALSRADALALM